MREKIPEDKIKREKIICDRCGIEITAGITPLESYLPVPVFIDRGICDGAEPGTYYEADIVELDWCQDCAREYQEFMNAKGRYWNE